MSKYRITIDGKTYEMEIERMDGAYTASAAEKSAPAAVSQQAAPVSAPAAASSPAPAAASGAVVSPMPGTILKVAAAQGDTVQKGQLVLVLEAMKMENEILAQKDGVITALYVKEGDSVQGGAALFEIGE